MQHRLTTTSTGLLTTKYPKDVTSHGLSLMAELVLYITVVRSATCCWLCCVSQDSEQYVEKLLELFNRFSLLVNQAFTDDPRFLTSRDMV